MAGDKVVRPRTAPPSMSGPQRLLLMAVGLALVLMHHLVGAHQHTPSMSAIGVESSGMTGHSHDPAAVGAPDSTAAALHVHHPEGGHDMAAMLHDCLAVLAAAAALALVLWLLRGGIAVDFSRTGTTTVRPRTSRPPAPVPVVLAQLQVLRL